MTMRETAIVHGRLGYAHAREDAASAKAHGFRVRAMLQRRHRRQAERALANVDQFLELAKPYAVRGLRAFAEAMSASWEAARM